MVDQEAGKTPNLALIGAGIFVRSQYVPRLREVAHLLSLKLIWSRTEEAAKAIVPLVKDFAPNAEAKWGTDGLKEILQDDSIHGVAVVVAGQVQVELTLQAIKAGKHVLQEKPASSNVLEALEALNIYKSIHASKTPAPIWAVAENYRFEVGLMQAARLVKEVGDIMAVEMIAEAPMNSSNPYFGSEWRRNFQGGFTVDVGVHFIAGLRMMVGSEIVSVAAISRHVDLSLPGPDNMSALLKLENGCPGVFVMSISATSRKISWRVVGAKGTVEAERGTQDGQHGYLVTFLPSAGVPQSSFYPFCGVHEELTAFATDMANVTFKGMSASKVDSRSSPLEGATDVAVVEAMLRSSSQNGAWENVQPIK